MAFFHLEGNDGDTKFAVNSHWWLYLAVTIPLTLGVVVAWYAMVKRRPYIKMRNPTSQILDPEKYSGCKPVPGPSNSNSQPISTHGLEPWVRGPTDWKGPQYRAVSPVLARTSF